MGAWAAGILDDDLAQDIQVEFEDGLGNGASPAVAAQKVLRTNREILVDPDEEAVVYLALATLLAEHGVSHHPIFDRAAAIIDGGLGLDRWREAGPDELQERLHAYATLAEAIESVTARDEGKRKRPRLPRVGDVLEIPLPDGRYAYAQYIRADAHHGPVVQVFDEITPSPITTDKLSSAGLLFPPVIVGVNPPVRSGHWRIIGQLPPPELKYPLFRAGNADKSGKVTAWWIWDGNDEIRIGEKLPERYRHLEIEMVWSYSLLEERIMNGGRHPIIDRIH